VVSHARLLLVHRDDFTSEELVDFVWALQHFEEHARGFFPVIVERMVDSGVTALGLSSISRCLGALTRLSTGSEDVIIHSGVEDLIIRLKEEEAKRVDEWKPI